MAAKRKHSSASADQLPVDPSEELMFLCLGGGNEVGRSCHILQYKGKTVMLDAGMHPAYEGLAALPFFDEFDLSTVDVLLISHFHVDHAAALPYVLAKTNFKGRVFMTHPTKAIYKWLIQDAVRVGNTSSADQRTQLYTEADHNATFPRIEAIDYHTTHTISAIRITPYPAGHVLGAAMFLVEIAGLKILFTGDYSREEDRHLIAAAPPPGVAVDVLITESTFGIASHVPRVEREQALLHAVGGILGRGGRVLMPVSAVGRAQEVLLILDEHWAARPELQRVPIYYCGWLARKCMGVYQAYIGAMNDRIKRRFHELAAESERRGGSGSGGAVGGPWDLRYVRGLRSLERFDDAGGCVVLASPGMLQNGVSRELLERWAPNERNGVVVTGYSVEGTMAKDLLKEPDSIPAIMGPRGSGQGGAAAAWRGGRLTAAEERPMIPRRCSVQEFSFAAHVDGHENRAFIEEINAPVVILVHGEKHNMMRLKSKLLSLNHEKTSPARIYSPANAEEVRIPFRVDKTAKVVGRLAQTAPPIAGAARDDGAALLVSGVLVQNDFKLTLMAPADLREYAGLTTTTVRCRQRLTLHSAAVGLIRWSLEGTFGAVEEVKPKPSAANGDATDGADANGDVAMNGDGGAKEEADEEIVREPGATFLVMGCVTVACAPGGVVTVEWEGNALHDGIADAVMAVLFTVETSPASVVHSSKPHTHAHDPLPPNPHAAPSPAQRLERLLLFLEAQFGDAITPIARPPLLTKSLEPRPSAPGIKAEPPTDEDDADALAEREAAELARLRGLGLPVPGLAIRVGGATATVWLETLAVECASAVLGPRVRAVVERACETVAPLWSGP